MQEVVATLEQWARSYLLDYNSCNTHSLRRRDNARGQNDDGREKLIDCLDMWMD